ncbi:MAG TPA: response regulator transcription factor [Trebonia sp.]
MTLRILLADDQALLRGTFRLLIEAEPDMEVVGEAGTGRQAAELTRANRPDVVVMDIRMPDLDGLAATGMITADPGLADTKILILTTFEDDDYVAQALRAGASGFLSKGADPAELLRAIRVVAAGEALLSPAATKGLITRYLAQPAATPDGASRRLESLTPREREIMALAATGLSNDDIAAKLFITPLTVKTHVNRAMFKLGARDRAQLVVIAYETGIVRAGQAPPRQ